jgi:hypothetical protein
MPTINLEMMKQLLQEFSEKEALTTEEINVIEKEITTLEERAKTCHSRLQNLDLDKEKLHAMKERYVSGNFPKPERLPFGSSSSEDSPSPTHSSSTENLQTHSSQINNAQTYPPQTASQNSPAVEMVASDDTSAFPENSNNTGASAKPKEVSSPVVSESTAFSVPDQADNNDHQGKSPIEEGAKESNEPIKSINDALKGLFRK